MRWRSNKIALAIFVLALLVRVSYNLTVAAHYQPLHDSAQYRDIGLHIVQTHCFCLHGNIPTVGRAPLWPLLIGLLSLLFGPNDLFVRLFLCVLDAATCLLIYLFARRLLTERLALVAGMSAAFYPNLFIYTGWLYSETLYTFLLTAFCYLLYRFQRERTLLLAVASGLLPGLLALTRPNGLVLLVLFLVWLLVMGWQRLFAWRYVGRMLVLVPALALLLIVPWTWRNYLVTQRVLPIATGDGTVLLGSYNDLISQRSWDQMTWLNPLTSVPGISRHFPLYTCDARCEIGREELYKDYALLWMQTHLDKMPSLLTAHLANMWVPDAHEADLPTDRFTNQISTRVVLVLMRITPWPIYLLFIAGLWFTRRRWRDLLFVYGVLLVTIAQNIAFYGIPRFRAPIEPLLILLAVAALPSLLKFSVAAKRFRI
ncbi:ArnT family glycosyltransferase [Dictyobacter alpinus]|nr:glycosyltransferase family 39 protein [Dictyobacter alpinus]